MTVKWVVGMGLESCVFECVKEASKSHTRSPGIIKKSVKRKSF